MLTKTPAFLAAEQAGYLPIFYIYADTDLSRRCFILSGSPISSGYTGYYDGSGYVGDGNTFGLDAGIVQTRALLLSNPTINKTVTQGSRGLTTVLSSSQVGHVYTEYDNLYKEDGKYYFSNILTGENAETFLKRGFEVRMGFPGLSFGDQLSLFRGTITDSPLKGPKFSLSADAVSSTLYDVWKPPKSSLYTNPAQDNQPLPLVLGDMTENANIDEDGDGVADKGPIPLVCIDTVNDVWAMACHALVTAANGQTISLYDDDGLINAGDYTYTASGDYETVGVTIAYVTFTTPPTGTVTGKYYGAPDDDGDLITNPILNAEKMLSIMGEITGFEATSFQASVNDADAQGYVCAGVAMADNQKAYWLGTLLSNFLGSWFLNENNEIVIQLDTGNDNFLNTAGILKESMLKGVPTLDLNIDNLITQPVINYAVSYAQIDRRFKTNANTAYLQTYNDSAEADDIIPPIDVDFCRNTDSMEAVATRIAAIYNPLKLYKGVKTIDFSLVNWEPGDYFIFQSSWQYTSSGYSLCGQIGRITNITIDGENREISLDFYDTGNFLLSAPYIYDGSHYVGDGSTFGGDRACAQIEEPGTAPDPAAADTVLLIHSNTTDGSTTFVDSSPNAHTVVANGTTTHSTDTAVFGTTSVKVWPGWLSIASHADFFLDGNDFTIDFWVNPVSYAINGDAGFIVIKDSTNFQIKTYNGNLYGYFGLSALGPYSLTESAWTHIAGVRYGNTFTLYADGVAQGSLDCTGLTVLQGAVYIGYNYFNPARNLNGYFDEFRIVNGTAAWATDFTPPTSPYTL